MVASKRYFPVFLDLEARPVVIVGEGPAAEKRARQLARYGADIVVITPAPSESLLEGQQEGALVIEQRSYVRGDLNGAFLALCVTEDDEIRRAVHAEAESLGCLINVADVPELCNFIMPSVLRRGSLEIAISTGGLAPEAAKALRRQLDADLGDEWAAWIQLLSEVRALAAGRYEDAADMARAMDAASQPSVRERLAAGEQVTAQQLLDEAEQSCVTEDDTTTEGEPG